MTFGDEVRALRDMLAEQGVEVTESRLFKIIEDAVASTEERECFQCQTAFLGLCYACLVLKIQEDL